MLGGPSKKKVREMKPKSPNCTLLWQCNWTFSFSYHTTKNAPLEGKTIIFYKKIKPRSSKVFAGKPAGPRHPSHASWDPFPLWVSH